MNTLSFLRHNWTVMTAVVLGLTVAFLIGGCASTPPVPNERLAVAEAAVNRASSTSTSENAPAELQIAIAKLASARQAVASEDMELAGRLAEQAVVDAQVAELRAQAARSKKSALESQEAARVLREEIDRKTVR
jgi:hypothetical protein